MSLQFFSGISRIMHAFINSKFVFSIIFSIFNFFFHKFLSEISIKLKNNVSVVWQTGIKICGPPDVVHEHINNTNTMKITALQLDGGRNKSKIT